MGTEVTVFQRSDKLIASSEPEISDLLLTQMKKRMNVLTSIEVIEFRKEGNGNIVIGKNPGNNSLKMVLPY